MRLLWEEEAWEAKRLLSADSSLFVLCIMVKSILRAQSHFHHIGKTLLALLGGGDLRRDETVRNGQQTGRIFAQHLCIGKQGEAFHLHAQAVALVPQLFPVGGLCVGRLAVEHIGRVNVALDEPDALDRKSVV